MIHWIKDKYRRIKTIIEWIPLLWNTRDYDYRDAIEVFKYQLNRIADFLESDKALSLHADYYAKRTRTITRLMKKVYDEDYAVEYIDKLEKICGGDDYCYNRKEVNQLEDKLFKESREKQEKAHRILWELMQNNIQNLWD